MNQLQHHGIKGMKWGIRRYQNRDGSLTPEGKKRYSEDYTSAHEKKSISEMSDAELRKKINRLQMEKTYKSFYNDSESSIAKGKNIVNRIVKAGTTLAAVTSTGLTLYNNIDKISKLIKKK